MNTEYKDDFNGILINRYNSGEDYIGAHSDNENGLSKSGVVAFVYGATRTLRIRNKRTKEVIVDLDVPDGYTYRMTAEFNRYYTHEIPIQKTIKEPRVSLTFRKHI